MIRLSVIAICGTVWLAVLEFLSESIGREGRVEFETVEEYDVLADLCKDADVRRAMARATFRNRMARSDGEAR